MEVQGLNLSTSALITVAAVLVVYFILIAWFGGFFTKFSKDVNDFFYSGQRFAWWLGAASMIATGIGSYSYLKYSQQGMETGLSSAMTYTNDWFIIPFFMFGWLPIIYFSRVKSIPEYFARRFNDTARYIALVIILAYMLFYIGYNLFTMGVALQGLLGISMYWSIPLVTLVLGGYVTFGGQTAVIFTDLAQGIMLYIAGGIAIIAGLVALGGIGEWWAWLPVTHRLPFVHLFNDYQFNTAELFWGEALAGSIAFTFMNQGFIMRYLALKSVNEGRKACIFNVLFTLPFSAIIVGAVGWIAKSLVIKQAAMGGMLEGINAIHIENYYHTFLIVAWECLKQNALVFGFVVAALSAALMSTVDTLINACAAIGIYDIYKPLIKKGATERHYLIAARWMSALIALGGLFLSFSFIGMKGSLMAIHYKGIMLIIPALVTTIFLGAFWRRFNTKAACVSMVFGAVLTFATEFSPALTDLLIDPIANFVLGAGLLSKKYIYMRALFGMIITALVGIIVTLVTARESDEKTKGLTICTLEDAKKIYKGSDRLNEVLGKKVGKMAVEFNDSLKDDVISVSNTVMHALKAQADDMIYVEDQRWWLGGLRSLHTKAANAHHKADDIIMMSKKTWENGLFLDGKKLKIEKIF
ncbi:MAG: hypothetical protein A2381_16495 [Bdellovibrionales bacterium RIFOXYB1_FULL_37_110]|nr:MAG: hypothetical protein A2181_07500 [Bdellovibrionales bacterium RIFOXYA1_FULL_38_20]OFZ49998.1 MAG: hypothetical protein A2417_18330 [Bdellovibrionales bacterium RIFOXYC1_FULL_37_79]OFZ59904.1 MAG: hypothetical protein A2381_16495 [Bdellovibrionales bacterium RIFOXYB1_FULL_37_110]OFZ63875.1 MAG: hypothetical protein A2577_05685 [Bdellovibrionales bacterium RIFOXYD1_FULL_36_51]